MKMYSLSAASVIIVKKKKKKKGLWMIEYKPKWARKCSFSADSQNWVCRTRAFRAHHRALVGCSYEEASGPMEAIGWSYAALLIWQTLL